MANCNRCSEPIFFAWHESWLRWLPCELNSVHDEDVEHKGGLLYASHHQRHRCGAKNEAREWKRTTAWGVVPPLKQKSPHAQLFVTSDAPIEVIRAAYKALAMLYHPDYGGDPERMVELNRAYATLLEKE